MHMVHYIKVNILKKYSTIIIMHFFRITETKTNRYYIKKFKKLKE